ncbi:MAG: HEAT repeat domain-containing protein [Gemmatimonadaceae bacterium]|nr:HEAT repeat domain-containing protein [Gemmatimonadaceae bacterium]
MRALSDPTAVVREGAAIVLGQIGRPSAPAMPALVETLADQSFGVRLAVSQALKRIGPASVALPRLAQLAAGADNYTALLAVEAMGNTGADAAVHLQVLIQLMGRGDEDFKSVVITSIGRIGPLASPAIPRLIDAARSESPGIESQAIEALGKIGSAAAPAVTTVTSAARDPAREVRIAATHALARLSLVSPEVRPVLIGMLQDTDPRVRSQALASVKTIVPLSDQELPAVAELLRDPDIEIRQEAVQIIEAQKASARPAERQLLAALFDSSPFVKQRAALSLRALAPISPEGIRAMLPALADSNYLTSKTLIETIGASGRSARIAVPTLVRLLEDPLTHGPALAALKRIGPQADEVVPALIQLSDLDVVGTLSDLGLGAVPQLRTALRSGTTGIRRRAVSSLVRIGARDTLTIKSLVLALRDTDPSVSETAAGGLVAIGAGSIEFVVRALSDPSSEVRIRSLRVLAQLPASARPKLPTLRSVLNDSVAAVRYEAAVAISTIESPGELLLRPLILSLNATEPATRRRAAAAIEVIAKDMADASRIEAIPILQEAARALSANSDDSVRMHAKEVERSVRYLGVVWWQKLLRAVREFESEHRIATLVAAAYVLVLVACLLALWLRPLLLFRVNHTLSRVTEIKLPEALGGVRIPLSYLLVVGIFRYRARVLRAWAAANVAAAARAFEERRTVEDRRIHVPMPVVFDRTVVATPSAATFRPLFRQKRSALVIYGEGGAGKTSLAVQLARWAMVVDPELRLNPHAVMLPLLLEYDLGGEHASLGTLVDSLGGQLRTSLGLERPLRADLLLRLLQQGLILVIIDHLSEMSDETRKAIRFDSADFPINALIVTSRIEEELQGTPRSVVTPLRIQGNRLSSFMEAYLTQRGWRNAFDDAEYFEACRRLSEMVGQRDITVLLAKLYADQLIAEKEAPSAEGLPRNIPELMLSYLNEVNRSAGPDDPDDRTVHRTAKIVAWACLRDTLRPVPASHDAVVRDLGGDLIATPLIRYFEEKLRLLQTVGPARDRLRFSLDPVAEYLAAIHLVESLGTDTLKWHEWMSQAESELLKSPTAYSFILAVRDSCEAKSTAESNLDSVIVDLSKLVVKAVERIQPASHTTAEQREA